MTPFPRVGGGEELLKLTPGHGHGDLHVDRIPLPWPRLRQASLVVCRTQILPRQVPRAQPPTWCSLGVALPGRLAAVSAVELCPGRSGVSAVELCPGRSGVSAVELCPGRSGVSAVELCPGRSGVSAVELCPGEVRRVCRGVVSREIRRVCRGVVSREVRRVCRGVVSRGGQAVSAVELCPGRSGRVCRGVVSREVRRVCRGVVSREVRRVCRGVVSREVRRVCRGVVSRGGQACLPWSCVPGRSGVSAVELCPGEVRPGWAPSRAVTHTLARMGCSRPRSGRAGRDRKEGFLPLCGRGSRGLGGVAGRLALVS
nr:uncharacterized protein LOC127486706 isoform X12 [Oryctolagus cuniculus]